MAWSAGSSWRFRTCAECFVLFPCFFSGREFGEAGVWGNTGACGLCLCIFLHGIGNRQNAWRPFEAPMVMMIWIWIWAQQTTERVSEHMIERYPPSPAGFVGSVTCAMRRYI